MKLKRARRIYLESDRAVGGSLRTIDDYPPDTVHHQPEHQDFRPDHERFLYSFTRIRPRICPSTYAAKITGEFDDTEHTQISASSTAKGNIPEISHVQPRDNAARTMESQLTTNVSGQSAPTPAYNDQCGKWRSYAVYQQPTMHHTWNFDSGRQPISVIDDKDMMQMLPVGTCLKDGSHWDDC